MRIAEDQLKEWLGIKQRTRLMRALHDMRIPYVLGAGGRICTTQGAIDSALYGAAAVQEEEIEFM
jgi:hypothetical protein